MDVLYVHYGKQGKSERERQELCSITSMWNLRVKRKKTPNKQRVKSWLPGDGGRRG